jgi:hypothetical protein
MRAKRNNCFYMITMLVVTYILGLALLSFSGVAGDTPMTDLQDRLERFETLTAECELIAKLATDSKKRELYLHLAVQYRDLAVDMRRAIASHGAV